MEVRGRASMGLVHLISMEYACTYHSSSPFMPQSMRLSEIFAYRGGDLVSGHNIGSNVVNPPRYSCAAGPDGVLSYTAGSDAGAFGSCNNPTDPNSTIIYGDSIAFRTAENSDAFCE